MLKNYVPPTLPTRATIPDRPGLYVHKPTGIILLKTDKCWSMSTGSKIFQCVVVGHASKGDVELGKYWNMRNDENYEPYVGTVTIHEDGR